MGTWEQLYKTPQHPYTVKLLESTPLADKRGTQLHTIAGRVPKATAYNDGCRFADRCPKVMDGCETIPPILHVVNGSEHNVACHLYNPEPPFNAVSTGASKLELETDTDKIEDAPTRTAEAQPQLQVKNLCVHYPIQKGIFKRTVGYVYAVDDVTLDIRAVRRLHSSRIPGPAKPLSAKPSSVLAYRSKVILIYDALTQRDYHTALRHIYTRYTETDADYLSRPVRVLNPTDEP
ncbi:Putative peptide import ATP-binding protein BAB2_1053 [Geodia barretti]|uniref:Peptide import ATP-binding protein BAB2_1053 n=1 Tax=Geodia barretti TaxID=519541 RepID=A0AA35T2S4_GEOBA|nr:Putative peptide import ATP-binding protein BAB2_1053 [Geodia barretti]